MKIQEIKEKLKEQGWDESDFVGLKKEDLVKMLIPSADEVTQEDINELVSSVPPEYGSLEWDEHVMSLFKEHELIDGNPTVVGLRRVAEKVLGPIVDSGPIEIQANMPETTVGRATCTYSVTFYPWRAESEEVAVDGGWNKRVFRASADSFVGNTDGVFAVFPVAIAETRAEARALRRALLIKNVSHDELTKESVSQHTLEKTLGQQQETSTEWDEEQKISSTQIAFLEKKTDFLGIDINKFINSGEKKYSNLQEIARGTAAKMIERINQYQTEQLPIPAEIKKG